MTRKTSMVFALGGALLLGACGGAEPESAAREAGGAAAPATVEPSAGAAQHAAGAPVSPAAEAAEARPAPAPPAVRGAVTTASTAAASTPAVAQGRPAPASSAPAEAASETPADAAAVLRRAERAYADVRSLEADFAQEVSIPLLGQTVRSRGKMYHRRPDRFLMKFTDPAGDVVVADGRYLWMYYPSADPKQVMRTSIAAGGQQVDLQKEFLSNPLERYHAKLIGREPVGGRPAHVLELVPKGPSGYRQVRIWVDAQDALVRRFEITEENESVRRLELSGLKPNVALADELFRFDPPPGAQVFEQ